MEVELNSTKTTAVTPGSQTVTNAQTPSTIPTSGSNFKDYSMSDKLTSMMVSSMLREPAFQSRHRRNDTEEEEEEEGETEEEEEEIEDEDFGDIQFFHQHHRRQIMSQQINGKSGFLGNTSNDEDLNSSACDSIPSANLNLANFNFNGSSSSSGDKNLSEQDSPFVFPDNVMEYGEPQFFPGNCVGYLETILEETDEEYEEEEGCSGRHWWTADSDTDTDSVIRVDPTVAAGTTSLINPNQSFLNGKTKSAEEPLSFNKSPFRTSASSRPFELEDLHLLDQLDLAFEETLMEPRRRTGFAFGHQLNLLEQPFVTGGKNVSQMEIVGKKELGDNCASFSSGAIKNCAENLTMHSDEVQGEELTKDSVEVPEDTECKIENLVSNECAASVSSSESSEAPAEMAEEDFFYSSPSEGSEEEEESNHSTTEEETSSSDDSDKNGVVLAEFSLNSAGNLMGNEDAAGLGAANGFNLGLYGSRNSSRRAFESQSSRLRSFRSFDSLNSLAGTELLFSKAETFPSFHYIKEVAEPGCSSDVPGAGSGESQSLPLHHSLPHNSSEEDCFAVSGGNKKISKKNSSSSSTSTSTSAEGVEGMSTENLSEDSGIGAEGSGSRNHLPLQKLQSTLEDCSDGGAIGTCENTQQQPQSFSSCSSANEYISKSEFALNPFVYSSMSDQETSMSLTSVNNTPSCSSDPDLPPCHNNSSFDSNLDKSSPQLPEARVKETQNESERNPFTGNTSTNNKTRPTISPVPLIEEENAVNLSSDCMQTYNKETFIPSTDSGTSAGSPTANNCTDSQSNDRTPMECGLHPLSPSFNPNLDSANVHNAADKRKTNNLPELLGRAESEKTHIKSVPGTLPLLLQNLFVEQQCQPPDLLQAVQCSMEIQAENNLNRNCVQQSISHLRDSGSGHSKENSTPENSVGVPLEQPQIKEQKNLNEISSSVTCTAQTSVPHEFLTTQLSSSLEFDMESGMDDQENEHCCDTERITATAYEPFRRERSNSESEFESVESSIEEEDSQSMSVASILNAQCNNNIITDEEEPFGDMDRKTDAEPDTMLTHDDEVNSNHANGKSGPMSTLGCGSVVDARSNSNNHPPTSPTPSSTASEALTTASDSTTNPTSHISIRLPRRNMKINERTEQSDNNSVPPPPPPSSPPPSMTAELNSFLLVDDSSELATLSSSTSTPATYSNGESKSTLLADIVESDEEDLQQQQPSRSVTLDESSCADVVHHHLHPAATEEKRSATALSSTSASISATTTTTTSTAEQLNNQSDTELSGKRSSASCAPPALTTSSLVSSGATQVQASISGFSNFGIARDSSTPSSCRSIQDASLRSEFYTVEPVSGKVNEINNLELKSEKLPSPVADLGVNQHLENTECRGEVIFTDSNSSVPLGAFGARQSEVNRLNDESRSRGFVVPDVVLGVREEEQDHYSQSGDSDKADSDREEEMEIGHRRSTSPPSTNMHTSTTTPVPLKTYGARNEVEVYLVSSRTPSPSLNPSLRLPSQDTADQEEGKDPPAKVSKSRVHFSPVVSEISWRESYIDQSSEFSGSSEDLLTKLEAFESENTLHNNGSIGAGVSSYGSSDGEQVTTGSSTFPQFNSSGDREPVITSALQPQAPLVIHKVQMTSSLLHGGEDEGEDEDDANHRDESDDKNTNAPRLPIPIDKEEDDDGMRLLTLTQPEEPTSDFIEFKKLNGSTGNSNGISRDTGDAESTSAAEIIYEDVNVEIEPVILSPTCTLSMVPDLLSQCENANNSQTHIDVRIEENPIQIQPTKQILPKMFAEKGSEGKNNSLTSLSSSSSSKQKKASKGFSIQGLGSSGKKSTEKEKEKMKEKEKIKEKEKEKIKDKEKESEAAKENSGGKAKVGFFERLSKIRLSGSSKNKSKQKIHPKSEAEPQSIQDSQASTKPPLKIKSTNAVNGNASVNNDNNKLSSTSLSPSAAAKSKSPILKKAPANSPTPIISTYNSQQIGGVDEPDLPPTEAFDNILEEIAGLKTIKMRQEKVANNQSTSPSKAQSPTHQTRSFAERKQFYSQSSEFPAHSESNGYGRSLSELDTKLSQFTEETTRTRDQISKSHPDLEVIEDTVKQHSISASPEPPAAYSKEQQHTIPLGTSSSSSPKKSEAGQKNEREWYKLLKSAAEKYYYRGSSSSTGDLNKSKNFKTGIVETDLDTGASREMLDEEILELEKVPSHYMSSTPSISTAGVPTSGIISVSVSSSSAAASPGTAAKARSLTNLSSGLPLSVPSSHSHSHQNGELQGDLSDSDERAKSLEFLLDENHKSSSVPPENKLRLESRQLSEHELRIQRSLQRLNVPEWYKKHEAETTTTAAHTGTIITTQTQDQTGGKQPLKLLTRRSDYGSASGLAGGWAGLSAYKTPSLSSLHSSNGGRYSGSLNRSNFVRGRPVTMSATRTSRESLMSPSPASQSPSAFDRCSFTYGMPFSLTRFGHGRLSNHSTSVSPASTPDSSLLTATTTNTYVKKPYLGWRSQERLNAAAAASTTTPSSTGPKLSIYLPPAERLANEILAARTKSYSANKPTGSERPPLPKPPPRAEKTALTAYPVDASNPNPNPIANTTLSPTNSTTVALSPRDQPNLKRLVPDVHESIREVTKAINNQFTDFGEEEPPRPIPRQKSGKKPAVWMESSFVGRKPL